MKRWVLLTVVGCSGDAEPGPEGETAPQIVVFGDGSHDVAESLEQVGSDADGLSRPQDLAFHPEVADELWVVSRLDDSMTIYDQAGAPSQQATHLVDPYALHFMEQVSSIAFGAPGRFATCQDSRNTYNGQVDPDNFMGPALWSSDRQVFAQSNPEAVEELSDLYGFPVDLGSHLDMLHESPNCMGIAWDHDNVYWVFDGYHDSIVRYDFQVDHGPGYDDHSDGIIDRWVEGEVQRVPEVPSHLILDHDSGLLYIADTGNNRVAVLDTTSGEQGALLPGFEPGVQHHQWDGGDIQTLVDGDVLGMAAPSGIDLVEGMLIVTDAVTGRIHAFDLEGQERDWAETGRTSLAGVYGRSLDDLWVIDPDGDEILRLEP